MEERKERDEVESISLGEEYELGRESGPLEFSLTARNTISPRLIISQRSPA